MAAAEPERYVALERVGFKVDPFGSITYQLYERFGGHYVDVGASAKIAAGLVCFLFSLNAFQNLVLSKEWPAN
jgi:hypothetical protein